MRHRGLVKFKELASRLNGVQIPVFGVSWTPPEPKRSIVREVQGVELDELVNQLLKHDIEIIEGEK